MLIAYLPKILLRNFIFAFLSLETSWFEAYNPIKINEMPTPAVNPSITSGNKLNLEDIKNMPNGYILIKFIHTPTSQHIDIITLYTKRFINYTMFSQISHDYSPIS